MKPKQLSIDLSGPFGNAFFLMEISYLISMHTSKDGNSICNRMRASDYDNLLYVFISEFGEYVQLVNMPKRRK
jgi:hypothetical protein